MSLALAGAGDQRGGQKEKQIDGSRGSRFHLQDHGQPQYQQTAATNTDAGKKAKQYTNDQNNR